MPFENHSPDSDLLSSLTFALVPPAVRAGSIFTVVSTPNPNAHGNTFNGLAAISASDAWAVGYVNSNAPTNSTQTLTEHWNGTTWQVVSSPNPGAATPGCPSFNTGNVLTAVSAVTSTDVWAVGYYFQCSQFKPLVLNWKGPKWSVVANPPLINGPDGNNQLNAVLALGTNNVYGCRYTDTLERWAVYPD